LSDALAETVIVPDTVAPDGGEVIETVGDVDPTVAGLLLELMSPAQPEWRMASGTTSSQTNWAIVLASGVTNLPENMIEPST
jgi:ribosomal protein S16